MADYYDQEPLDAPEHEEEGPSGIRPVSDMPSLEALLASDSPSPPLTVVVFVAPFCPHTKQSLIPALSEMCTDPEYQQSVVFALCDITESMDVVTAYEVIASPTIAIHFGTQKLYQYRGSDPAALKQVIARCLIMRQDAIADRVAAEAAAAAAAATAAAAASVVAAEAP